MAGPDAVEVEFHKKLVTLAGIARHRLQDREAVEIDRLASERGYEESLLALNEMIYDHPAGARFPSLQQFREAFQRVAKVSDEMLAEDAAQRILTGIGAKGRYWNPTREAREEYFGELASEVVYRFGGWQRVCEEGHLASDLKILRPQLKRQAMMVLELSRNGLLRKPPGLPKPLSIDAPAKPAGKIMQLENQTKHIEKADPRALIADLRKSFPKKEDP